MSGVRLLDETTTPSLRAVIGQRMETARAADFAVTRIRLATLDLRPEEVAGPDRCRVLLGQLDASTLLDAGAARREALDRLAGWVRSGKLLVRSAGIGAWTPDFSVYHGPSGAGCLLGAHYFGSPQLTVGPSFTAVTEAPDAVAILARRFEELWGRSHDVLPAIAGVLDRVRAGAPGGS